MAATLNNWKPYTEKVDNSGQREGLFGSGAFMLVCAGPPRLSNLGGFGDASAASGQTGPTGDWALPIGLVQGVNLGHNRQFNRFWELGSERSYTIAGRTVAQLSFGRIHYHGPSLLRMLYSFYPLLGPYTTGDLARQITPANPHVVKFPPGYENIFYNLASDLFSQPCGLLLVLKDSGENNLGAMYAEETYVPSHSMAVDASGTVIQEQVSLQPERVRPVNASPVQLVTDAIITQALAPSS
jgi:hypothetical protein